MEIKKVIDLRTGEECDIGGGDVDLSNYVSKDELTELLDEYINANFTNGNMEAY